MTPILRDANVALATKAEMYRNENTTYVTRISHVRTSSYNTEQSTVIAGVTAEAYVVADKGGLNVLG
jgi:hypothetical protein